MVMEHRLYPREPASYQAIVTYPPLGLVLGKVRDISRTGMSIDTSPITLNVDTPVKVTVRFQENGRERLSRFDALVVWAKDGRAGLTYRSNDQTHSEPGQVLRRGLSDTNIIPEQSRVLRSVALNRLLEKGSRPLWR